MDIFDETKLDALAQSHSELDLQMAVLQFIALSETAKEMGRADNVEDTVTLVTEQARALIGAHWAATLFDFNSRSDGICRWSFSDKFSDLRDRELTLIRTGPVAYARESNETVSQSPLELSSHDDPGWRAACDADPPMHGCLAAPLIGDAGRNVGLIVLSDKYSGNFDDQDAVVLQQLGQVAGAALAARNANRSLARRTEELGRANADLGQFASVTSRGLAEPLQMIHKFVDRLEFKLGSSLGVDGTFFLDRIRATTNRAQHLLGSVLGLSNIMAKNLEFSEIDLNELTVEVLEDALPQIQTSDTTVTCGNLPTITADRVMLYDLLQHLVDNALKFVTPGGIPNVNVRGRIFRGDHDLPVHLQGIDVAEITVSDNGIGFDPKDAKRIFRVFERIHGQAEIEGDGMGLAVCEKIVERHGGIIIADAEPETGATFTVTIPAQQPI